MSHRIRSRSSRSGASPGFGLLEVIVALVLLSSTGLALFAWIAQSLEAASRLRTVQQTARLLDDARSLVDDVNPARAPSGKRTAGSLAVEWTSDLLEPVRDSSTMIAGYPGSWSLGLFRLDVEVSDDSAGLRSSFSVLKVGYKPRAGIDEASRAPR